MPMSKLEAYLTVMMRGAAECRNREGLIFYFKEISVRKNVEELINRYCPKVSMACSGSLVCYECWESRVNEVLKEGGDPVL